jgi:hypothetical protein
LFSTTANVVKNVPNAAATNTNSRPQSLRPKRSIIAASAMK